MRVSNTSLEKLFEMRDAFEQSVADDVKAVGQQLGAGPFNSRHALSWDITYRQIEAAAKRCGLVVIPAKRGFWEFYMTLDVLAKELFVYMKDPNTNVSANKDWHYLNCLLYKHDSQNFDLLEDMIEDENLAKSRMVIEILGEYADMYEKVLVVSKTTVGQLVHHTSLKFYSSEGILIDSEMIPNRPSEDNDTYKPVTKPNTPIQGISLKENVGEQTRNDSEDQNIFDIDSLKKSKESSSEIK